MKIKSRLIGTTKLAVPALVGVALLGFAVPGTAGATPATYTAHAKAAGLVINLFGTELTGGTAAANIDSEAPSASAEGVGTLTPGLIEDQKASATGAGRGQTDPKDCAQGGSLPAGSPVGVTLGLACSSAAASISTGGAPAASASGEIAGLDVNASGVLDQIISSGGDQLFSGIQQILGQLNGTPLGSGNAACPDPNASAGSTKSSGGSNSSSAGGSGKTSTTAAANPLAALASTAAIPGSPLNTLLGSLALTSTPAAATPGPLGSLLSGLCQTLTNIENVAKGANPPSTLVVDIGPASASAVGTASDTAQASATGATAEVQVLPGVGCTASLVSCIAEPSAYAAPLIDIQVAPAKATDRWDGTTWVPSTTAALATITLNIPGDAQTISVSPGQTLDLLAGTPLETVVDLGSATTSGANSSTGSGTANGATLDLAKGIQGGILLDLGSASIAGGDSPATPAAAPPAHVHPAAVVAATQSAPPAIAPVASATLVHTGAWWSGSLPYVGGLATLGALLLGWPRLRTTKGLGILLRAARR